MNVSAAFSFRLYVTGNAPNSERAIANLSAMCRSHLADRHQIEVVDLLRDPERALTDGIFLTPTLVKLSPGPELRVVGSLSDVTPILASLGLSTA
jgi:circadian clock protein KaiB